MFHSYVSLPEGNFSMEIQGGCGRKQGQVLSLQIFAAC
jgi:hypothetical protein